MVPPWAWEQLDSFEKVAKAPLAGMQPAQARTILCCEAESRGL